MPVAVGVSVSVGVSVAVAVTVSVGVNVAVDVSVGVGVAQGFAVDKVLRGLGKPVVKSELLLSVSVQPFPARRSEVVLLGAGAAELSLQFVPAPYPTKSITLPEKGHPLPLSAVVEFTSATFPAVALRLILPVASGVGKFVVPPAPAAS